MKKCVVIGGGLGGLSCGCILAKNGYDVTVLEQGLRIGGCLQCFKRDGVVFDTGMHYIGSADKGQVLWRILNYLGVVDDLRLSRLNPMGYDIISLMGEHYNLANGKDNFIKTLAVHFPKQVDELSKYYDLIQLVASSSAMHSLNQNIDLNINAEYQLRSVDEVLNSVVSDPLLRQVLVGILPLYAGEKGRTPFSTHALITDFYNQSAFRIIGGSSVLADSLVRVIQDNGGRVLAGRKATKIECDETHAVAVIADSGECFTTDLVVSAIHPSRTMELIDSHLLRPAYRRRIESMRNTTSAFTVYLKFRKNAVKYMSHNLYYYRNRTVWGCENYDDAKWPQCLLYMHFCHKDNPVYAESGEILTYMKFEEMKQWIGTKVGRRGQSYEDFKKQKAETLIDALEEEFPGIRNDIVSYYTSTPLTYLDYTGIPEGAMYGVAKDANVIGTGSVSCKTRIPNLLLTGQSITSHGMLGVLAGSLVTCAEILTADEIFHQIKLAD